MLRFVLESAHSNPDTPFLFELYRVPRGTGTAPLPVTLKAVIGPGDDAEPVITVMQPDED